ncbi:MAG: hypothetical protein AAFY48_20255, partial [Bacteroidota bacterium]
MRFLNSLLLTICMCLPAVHYGQDAIGPKHTLLLSIDNYIFKQTKEDGRYQRYGDVKANLSAGLGYHRKFLLTQKGWISGGLNIHLFQQQVNNQHIQERIALQLNEVRHSDTKLRLLDLRLPISYGCALGTRRAFEIEGGVFVSYRLLNFSEKETDTAHHPINIPVIGGGSNPSGPLPVIIIGRSTESPTAIPAQPW